MREEEGGLPGTEEDDQVQRVSKQGARNIRLLTDPSGKPGLSPRQTPLPATVAPARVALPSHGSGSLHLPSKRLHSFKGLPVNREVQPEQERVQHPLCVLPATCSRPGRRKEPGAERCAPAPRRGRGAPRQAPPAKTEMGSLAQTLYNGHSRARHRRRNSPGLGFGFVGSSKCVVGEQRRTE